jgi:hypothetical protein
MDEYFEEYYKEGVVKWRKILGDFHKRILFAPKSGTVRDM